MTNKQTNGNEEIIGENQTVSTSKDYIALLKEICDNHVVIECTNNNYKSLFNEYPLFSENAWIVPIDDLTNIEKRKSTQGRDYVILAIGSNQYGQYKYDYSKYEFKYRKGGGFKAYSIYKSKRDFRDIYEKMMKLFFVYYLQMGDIQIAMQKSFDEVVEKILAA